jgi:retron-type reverse transcriptase
MSRGITTETVDAMSMRKIEKIIDDLRHERYRWTPVRRVYVPKKNGATRILKTGLKSQGTRSGVFL